MPLDLINLIKAYQNHLILTLFVWLTYGYTLRCGFVSDDLMGIADYDGKFQGWQYGMISRWLRYHICGGAFPSSKKLGDGKFLPSGKLPYRHHLLSIVVFNIAVLLGYAFLSKILGPRIALLALIICVVHPVTTQGVAWISALGYPLSLLWIFLSFNIAHSYYAAPQSHVAFLAYLAVFSIVHILAVNALFVAMMTPVILFFLGYNEFAICALIAQVWPLARVVKDTIDIRVKAFKEQSMGQSTFVKPRKLIVAAKTYVYYILLLFFPRRIGLYHTWGYHYGPDVERDDREFFFSLFSLLVIGWVFIYTPYFEVKLGLLWFSAFIFLFLNWITIQQFVTERYSFIPMLGVAIITAFFLQGHLWIYTFLVGLLLMRTWLHLPTYDDELKFYLSNVWNFESSEVAYGNLGVTQLRAGLVGTALESWAVASKVNPQYDVPNYNIYSHYKSNGFLQIQNGDYAGGLNMIRMSLSFLKKCVDAEVCHFREQWSKEYRDITGLVERPNTVLSEELERMKRLMTNLAAMHQNEADPKRRDEIASSLKDIQRNIGNLVGFMKSNNLVFVPSDPMMNFIRKFLKTPEDPNGTKASTRK